MINTYYKCNKCKQLWRYLPKRSHEDKLNNGQCDCGNYINLDNCSLEVKDGK